MSIKETTREALAELVERERPSNAPERESADEVDKPGQPLSGGVVEQSYAAKGFHLDIEIDPSRLVRAAEIMFGLGYFLESITGVDWIKLKEIEAVYDFSRYDFECCRVAVRVRTPREAPRLPTITPVYTGANWHERETHDFFGIVFDGHPNLVPLLLPEDADFHPLLKDFKA